MPPSPSPEHEALVLLFRNRPQLAAELLRDALGVPLPEFVEARIASAERTEPRPVPYRADLVVELRDASGPVAAVIVEVQLGRDARKRQTWPLYVTSVHAELRTPTILLVVTPDEGIAEWARRPIVVGPQEVPRVDTPEEAAADPELAVLSSMAHGDGEGGLVTVTAALHAVGQVDLERSRYYTHFILAALSDAVRARLEEEMRLSGIGELTDLEKRLEAQGEAKGRAQGRAQGRADAVLVVLESRSVAVTAEERARILSCTDEETLLVWLGRAASVETVDALFGDGS